MKATFDIPDELYRRVKARSAMEGRPVRSVAVELFEGWVTSRPAAAAAVTRGAAARSGRVPARFDQAPWLAIARRHVRPGTHRDLDALRAAIASGWGAEAADKLRRKPAAP